jgi:hypothetical protein
MWALAHPGSVFVGVLYLARSWRNPAWFIALLLHYRLCAWSQPQAAWPEFCRPYFSWADFVGSFRSDWTLFLVSPCAGFTWALSVARRPVPS